LLLSADGRKIGKRNGKHAGGKERSQATRRVYHVAETEESCGNYTELLSEEKPSELCEEVIYCTTFSTEQWWQERNAALFATQFSDTTRQRLSIMIAGKHHLLHLCGKRNHIRGE